MKNVIQFINGSKMYSTISLAKNMKLYIAVCCDIEYGTMVPSFLRAVFHSSEAIRAVFHSSEAIRAVFHSSEAI